MSMMMMIDHRAVGYTLTRFVVAVLRFYDFCVRSHSKRFFGELFEYVFKTSYRAQVLARSICLFPSLRSRSNSSSTTNSIGDILI